MEKLREEFEDWYRDYEGDDEFNYFARCPYEQEQYDLIRVHDAWNAWQASRAAMCVEIPDMPQGKYLSQYDEGFSDCLSIVITGLEDAGAPYK